MTATKLSPIGSSFCSNSTTKRRCFTTSLISSVAASLIFCNTKTVCVPADVYYLLHRVWDEPVQRGHADCGDVLGECVRRVHSSHQRWRRHVHEFIGVWVYVPAHVQQWLQRVWDELLQHGYIDRGDVLGGCVRRVRSSHQRARRKLHGLIGIWVYVPAHV